MDSLGSRKHFFPSELTVRPIELESNENTENASESQPKKDHELTPLCK